MINTDSIVKSISSYFLRRVIVTKPNQDHINVDLGMVMFKMQRHCKSDHYGLD